MAFAFEDLKVYQEALTWVEFVNTLPVPHLSRLKKTISDQLTRASLSIPLNIAEGNGRWHKAERRQYFWIARGSAFECVAIIQTMKKLKEISDDDYRESYGRLEKLSKMLSGLIKSVDAEK